MVLLSPLLCIAQFAPQKWQAEEMSELKLNQPLSRKLRGGEIHRFKVSIHRGEYVHVIVQQQGIDVVLTAISEDGREPIVVDRPNGAYGREGLSLIANQEQNIVIEISSLDPQANQGNYSITVD